MSFTDDVRTKLGVAKDADEDTIMRALDEALEERAEPAPTTAPANEVKDGQLVVSKAEWEEMKGDAQRGSAAAKKLHDMERKQALDTYKDRFLPANRKVWEDEYDRNPKATVDALKERPVVIPLDEIGHEIDSDTSGEAKTLDDVRNDPTYQSWRI